MKPFDNDSPFLANDEYQRGYKTWGDYLKDESNNGFEFICPMCNISLFIWLDCRRGDKDRYCVNCGHSHRPVVQAALQQAALQDDAIEEALLKLLSAATKHKVGLPS